MSLRVRFALLFSLFVFIILAISVTSIYILYEKFRKDEFYSRIMEQAKQSTAFFFQTANTYNVKKAELDRRIALTTWDSKLVILDTNYNLLYTNTDTAALDLYRRISDKSLREEPYYFTAGEREGLVYLRNGSAYIFTVAFDNFGRRKMENLKIILLFTLAGGLLLSGVFAYFYLLQIAKPLGELTQQMQRISETNLEERVPVAGTTKELTRIAKNFNAMLDRLENAFEMRKSFVQHASHELRTPLSNMLAQTEAALNKQLSPEESKHVLSSLREDQQHMIELTNSLLLLSKYERLPYLTELMVLRVDELLYEAIESINSSYPTCMINVQFTNVPENDVLLTVMGNDVLLKSALQNLVKNACHYSEDGKVEISIDAQQTGIKINFDNAGKQLNEDEKQRLFIPFFRGENSGSKKGYGLGLSIVQRIINLHKGTIDYSAINEKLNRFSISFPK